MVLYVFHILEHSETMSALRQLNFKTQFLCEKRNIFRLCLDQSLSTVKQLNLFFFVIFSVHKLQN